MNALNAQEIFQKLVARYGAKPDNFRVVFGHHSERDYTPHEFFGYMSLTVADLKLLANGESVAPSRVQTWEYLWSLVQ